MPAKHLIYGGAYREICICPPHNEFAGSGIRAARLLSYIACDERFEFHTRATQSAERTLRGLESQTPNITAIRHPSEAKGGEQSIFSYLNPLAPPKCEGLPIRSQPEPNSSSLAADTALVYDTLELRPVISANKVVFDPQSPECPKLFHENGSNGKNVALVLNHKEAMRLGGDQSLFESARKLQKQFLQSSKSPYDVIVIKMAHAGCWVCTSHSIEPVPAFATNSVFSIGSGDIFSAAFYYGWAVKAMSPTGAALYASKITANYCNSGAIGSHLTNLEDLEDHRLPTVEPNAPTQTKSIYLAGPFFSQAQISFIEFLRAQLHTPWTTVFSPFHDVGIGTADKVYSKDIEGLEKADVVFALLTGLDSGTLFEVGYAVKSNKKIICLAESTPSEELTMIIGSGAEVHGDVATAIYRTLWATLV